MKKDICSQMAKQYGEMIKATLQDVTTNSIVIIVEKFMEKNPYTLAVLMVRDTIDYITGVGTDIKQAFSMYCYAELANSIADVFEECVEVNGEYYESKLSNTAGESIMIRHLTHIANLRILGEQMYADWYEEDGIFGSSSDSEVESAAEEIISAIKLVASVLGVQVHPYL